MLGDHPGPWEFRYLAGGWRRGLRLGVGTGFLGGSTTFSTAGVGASRLARAGRGWAALVQPGGMLVVGVGFAGLGFWLGSS